MAKQGCGLRFGKMPQLDEKIWNNYDAIPGIVAHQRYETKTTKGRTKFHRNLANARTDIVRNYSDRVLCTA